MSLPKILPAITIDEYLEAWGAILEDWTDEEKDAFVADISANRFTLNNETSAPLENWLNSQE